jgi:hypothetical protein
MTIVGYMGVYKAGARFVDETGRWAKNLSSSFHKLSYINAYPIEFTIFNFGDEGE